eukprot:CAMPEP_0177538212 /NCGR_PEP_ID=MMETSP0369-20130122/58242_1 /TAXON_ID=447022 ORGANISM="Scrippsiella hangoei-like, Strain SHHI-4" /NCGR_SAMPLE_ID=MMETSP0369 /ASSEMBLY_ACC=CAM_ASM_000364 /LENGTH=38 /DNA_ID= /DNA_START= /DNA_END= /DNA_ORIENTATION=
MAADTWGRSSSAGASSARSSSRPSRRKLCKRVMPASAG